MHQYQDAKAFVNPFSNTELFVSATIECSEDHADDFTDWVVSQGRAFFDQVRNEPANADRFLIMYSKCEAGQEYVDMNWNTAVEYEEYRGWQSPGFIANGVLERLFGVDDNEIDVEIEKRAAALFQ